MCLDPRPSPQQVDACFAGDLTDDAVQGYLLTLQADPNWQVESASGGSCPLLMMRGKTKLATIGRNIEFGLALGANRHHQSCTNRKSANNNGDGRRSIFGERTGDPCRRQSRLIDAWIRIIKSGHDPPPAPPSGT